MSPFLFGCRVALPTFKSEERTQIPNCKMRRWVTLVLLAPGEQVDDLQPFDAKSFAEALFGEAEA